MTAPPGRCWQQAFEFGTSDFWWMIRQDYLLGTYQIHQWIILLNHLALVVLSVDLYCLTFSINKPPSWIVYCTAIYTIHSLQFTIYTRMELSILEYLWFESDLKTHGTAVYREERVCWIPGLCFGFRWTVFIVAALLLYITHGYEVEHSGKFCYFKFNWGVLIGAVLGRGNLADCIPCFGFEVICVYFNLC